MFKVAASVATIFRYSWPSEIKTILSTKIEKIVSNQNKRRNTSKGSL